MWFTQKFSNRNNLISKASENIYFSQHKYFSTFIDRFKGKGKHLFNSAVRNFLVLVKKKLKVISYYQYICSQCSALYLT